MILLDGQLSVEMPVPPDVMLEYVRDITSQVERAELIQDEINENAKQEALSNARKQEREELLKKLKNSILDQNFYSRGQLRVIEQRLMDQIVVV